MIAFRSELPQQQYEPLRLELFKAILRFSSGPKLVLTRLCVAMVMYMFHAVPNIWPNAIVSIITSLRNSSTHVSSLPLSLSLSVPLYIFGVNVISNYIMNITTCLHISLISH